MSEHRSFAGWSAWTGVADPAPPDDVLRTDGDARYARLALLGRGGMGEVELRHDARLCRDVAVKRVAPGAPPGAASLLVYEARLTAHLSHPGIVAVHDLGIDERGAPWVAMALVRGQTLADALKASVGPTARLHGVRPLLSVCEAVAFAHRAGVVHRDLKPANVFVGDLGRTQVGDWGLAEVLPGFGWETVLGPSPPRGSSGTPAYMAPEQEAGAAPDPRSDVYSLGAMLHELLVGAPPASGRELDGPAELVAIAAKATASDPAARYPDAAALAADLEHWLEGRRVDAYAYSTWDLAVRLARAWRAPLTVAAVAGLALVSVGAWSYLATVHERDRAVAAEAATRRALDRADHNLAAALVGKALDQWQAGAVGEAEVLAAHAVARGGGPRARGVLAGLAAEVHPVLVDDAPLPDGCLLRRLSADGGTLLCGDTDQLAWWTVGADAPRWRVPVTAVDAVILSDTTVLASRSEVDGSATLLRLDAATGRPRGDAERLDAHRRFSRSIDAGHAVLTNGQGVTVFDEQGVRPLTRCVGHVPVRDAVLTRAGTHLVAVCADGFLEVDDAPFAQGTLVRSALADGRPSAELALGLPDGDLLVAGSRGALQRLGVDHAERWAASPVVGPVHMLCVSADGGRAVVGSDRGAPAVIALDTGRVVARLPARARGVCAFDGTGQIRTVSDRVRMWSVPEAAPASYVRDSGLSWVGSDGDAVLAGTGDGAFVRWDAHGRARAVHGELRPMKGAVRTPDGAWVAVGLGIDGLLHASADLTTTHLGTAPMPTGYRRIGWLGSGWVWTSSHGHALDLWRWPDGGWDRIDLVDVPPVAEGWSATGGTGAVLLDDGGGLWWLADDPERPHLAALWSDAEALSVASDPEGDVVYVGARDGVSAHRRGDGGRLWQTSLGTLAGDLAVSRDGAWVGVAGLDGAARLLRASDGALIAELPGHTQRVGAVAFTDDGRWLLSAGWDGVVRRWATVVDVDPEAAEATWGVDLDAALASW